MHDLLEGTLQYEAKLILKHIIGSGYVSYAKISRILEGLELGYMESDDKPSQIPLSVINSNEKSLGQKGMGMKLITCLIISIEPDIMLYS